jgi:hydrogenase expression/formation protein HypC
MCLAVPMKVTSIDGSLAVTELDGVKRETSLMLLGEDVMVGDFVVVHAGFAISRLDEEEARETLSLMGLALTT